MGCSQSKQQDAVVSFDRQSKIVERQNPSPTNASETAAADDTMDRAVFGRYLEVLSQTVGAEMALNEDGVCAFTYEHLVIVMNVPESAGVFIFYATIDKPPYEDQSQWLERCLCLNDFQKETKGGCLSVDPEDASGNQVTFSFMGNGRQCASYDDFQQILEKYIEVALQLGSKMIAEGGADSGNDGNDNEPIAGHPAQRPYAVNRPSPREIMRGHMEVISKATEKSLNLNEDGICAFQYESLEIVVEVPAYTGGFNIYTRLIHCDNFLDKNVVIKKCLGLNYLQQETRGGCIGCDSKNELIFSICEDCYSVTGQEFRNILENFIDTALKFQETFKSLDGYQEQSGSKTTSLASQGTTTKVPPTSVQRTETEAKGFQTWKQYSNGGLRTTLEQEIQLAGHLCDQAIGPQEDAPTVGERIQTLRETPIRGTESLVTWKGIHVGWFLNVFCKCPYMMKLQEFGCELWFIRKVCVIEMIRRASDSNKNEAMTGPFVDHIDAVVEGWGLGGKSNNLWDSITRKPITKKPTTFISYTGGYTLEHVVKVLEGLDPNEYVWMDIFCVNQFAWTGKGRSEEMKGFRETFLEDLQGEIKAICKTALILEQWDNVMATLEQIWVLWEIFNTAEAGAELNVLLPPEQVEDFVQNCLENGNDEVFESILTSLGTIDASRGRAEDDVDRNGIFSRMQKVGLDKVNSIVIKVMREWMLSEGQKRLQDKRKLDEGPGAGLLNNMGALLYVLGRKKEALPLFQESLDQLRQESTSDGAGAVKTLNNLATLLHDEGRLAEAEPLSREALAKDKFLAGGKIRPLTLTIMGNLASILEDRGNLDEAEKLHRETLEECPRVLGNDHPLTLSSIHGLASFLKNRGKHAEAETLFRSAVAKRQRVLGSNHPHTLSSISGFAELLKAQRRLAEAEPMFRDCLGKRRQVLGDKNPATLLNIINLADVLQETGKLDEAESLFQEGLESMREVSGANHPDTLKAANNMASLYVSQKRLEEAGQLLREVLAAEQTTLGNGHPDTLVSMYNLAKVCKANGKDAESKALLDECVETSRSELGEDHPHTIRFVSGE